VQRLLDVTGLRRALHVFDTLDEAAGHVLRHDAARPR
jgi:hypothetical protein